MDSLLLLHLGDYRWLGYLIIFFGVMVEGDIVLFIAYFLSHNGFFDVGDLTVIALVGSLVGDLGWYAIGYKRFKFLNWVYLPVERITSHFDKQLTSRLLRIITLSKFTYGIHHALLIRCGMLRITIRDYLKDDLFGTVIWLAVIGSLGYFSGLYFSSVWHYLRYTEIGLLLALVVFLVVSNLISWWSRQKLD